MKFGEQEYYNVGDIVRLKGQPKTSGVVEAIHLQGTEHLYVVKGGYYSRKYLRLATPDEVDYYHSVVKTAKDAKKRQTEINRLAREAWALSQARAESFLTQHADNPAIQDLISDFDLCKAIYHRMEKQNEKPLRYRYPRKQHAK